MTINVFPPQFTLEVEEPEPELAFRKMNLLKKLSLTPSSLRTAAHVIDYLRILFFNEIDLYFVEDQIEAMLVNGRINYDQPDNLRKAMFKGKALLRELSKNWPEKQAKEERANLYAEIDAFTAPANAIKESSGISSDSVKDGIDVLIPRGYRGISPLGCAGLFASEDIKADEVILSIAESDIINLFTALRDPEFEMHSKGLLESGHHPDTVVLLYIVYLRRVCDERDYLPESVKLFFRSLKGVGFGTLLEWPVEAVDALGLSSVSEEVQKHKDILFDVYRSLPEFLCPTFEDLLWAKTLCSSRSFMNGNMTALNDFEEQVLEKFVPNRRLTCVIPGADLLNHSSRGQCSVPQFNLETRRLEITAECDIAKNSEIFLNYGGIANWEFLFHSGFTLPINPYDTMEIELEEEDEMLLNEAQLPVMHFIRKGFPKVSPKLLKAVQIVTGEDDPYETIEELLLNMCGSDPVVDQSTDWWLDLYGDRVQTFRDGYKSMVLEALDVIKQQCHRANKRALLTKKRH